MSVEVATQIVTMVLAVLAIIWHQQRSIDKLRDQFTQAIDKLRDAVVGNGQRIARIEGFLKIGMPADAAVSESPPPEPPASTPIVSEPAVEPATGG